MRLPNRPLIVFLLLAAVGGSAIWFFLRGSRDHRADSFATVLAPPYDAFVPEYDADPAATAQAAVDPKTKTRVVLSDDAAVVLHI